jgi:putative transposase
MPRKSRCVEAGVAHHVTQRGVDRQDVFFSHGDHLTYLSLIEENLASCGVRALAWCLMRNHVHWIVVPESEDSLAVLFRRVHGRYAQYLNARRSRTGHLWQNRFFSCPLGRSHLWTALRYVEWNPIRAGLVENADEYRWSSAAAHCSGPAHESGRMLDWAFWTEAGQADAWIEMIQMPEDLRETRTLQQCTYAGKPFGSDHFVQELENRFKRQWKPVGRPPIAATMNR